MKSEARASLDPVRALGSHSILAEGSVAEGSELIIRFLKAIYPVYG
jgi:hypothetical protein